MNRGRSNNKMQRTKHGLVGASPLILVLAGQQREQRHSGYVASKRPVSLRETTAMPLTRLAHLPSHLVDHGETPGLPRHAARYGRLANGRLATKRRHRETTLRTRISSLETVTKSRAIIRTRAGQQQVEADKPRQGWRLAA
jgi:hypothetical protein